MHTMKIFTTLILGLFLNNQAVAMQDQAPIIDQALEITSKMNIASIDAAIKASKQNNIPHRDIIPIIRAASAEARNEFIPELNKILEQDEELKIAITTAYRQITSTYLNCAPQTAEDELESIKNYCKAQYEVLLKIKLINIFKKIVTIEEKMSSACLNKSWETAEAESRKQEINEKESALTILEASKEAAHEFVIDFRNAVNLLPQDLKKKVKDSLYNLSNHYKEIPHDIGLALEFVASYCKATHEIFIGFRNQAQNEKSFLNGESQCIL